MSIKNIIADTVKKAHRNKVFVWGSRESAKEENAFAATYKAPGLSSAEIDAIKSRWIGVCENLNVGFGGFRFFKMHFGFNVDYVPFGYFFPWMVRVLNPIDAARAFAHKAMAYSCFRDIPQPKLIAMRVHGSVLDIDGNCLSDEDVIGRIYWRGGGIIKPSSGYCCGKGVVVIPKDSSHAFVQKILKTFSGDFVLQKLLVQSPATAYFNPSSLNTFRISTLLLNGRFSICTSMMRFGSSGSVVDNVGAGGGCVGVNNDGSLIPFGFDNAGRRITEWNGKKFDGYVVPHFSDVLAMARKAHLDCPLCAFVGWDFAIDENGTVNLIEANLESPGLFFEQLANGRPAFGERTEEVINYVRNHPLPLWPIYNQLG